MYFRSNATFNGKKVGLVGGQITLFLTNKFLKAFNNTSTLVLLLRILAFNSVFSESLIFSTSNKASFKANKSSSFYHLQ